LTTVVAFDPGVTTGFAAWGEDGLITSGQGPIRDVLRTWAPWMKRNRPAQISIEGAFLGKGARASLHVADSGGFIQGWLACAGLDQGVIRPMPSSWRKVIGIAPTKEGPGLTKAGRPRRIQRQRDELETDALAFASTHADLRFDARRIHEAEAVCMASAGWETWIARAA